MTAAIDEGVLAARIEDFLTAQVGRVVEVGMLRRFPVGFSWRTFGMQVRGLDASAEAQPLILRLGSNAGLFAPYSSRPEVLALRSLEGSAVPVPLALWSSDDASILGAPFMFCSQVEGAALVPWVSASAPPLDEVYRRGLATQFIDALAALHRLDWAQRPIAELAQGIALQNAALRNVEHWEALIQRWALRPYPLAEWGIRWLKAHAPVAPRVAIVHGDYRTGNFLESGGRITAILDWELVHLGDPHEDLGWASLPMYRGGSPYLCRLAEPDAFYARYGEQAGLQVSKASVHFYQVFSLLKLAATHMAATRCFEDGRCNDMRMPAMGSQIATCLRQMDKAIQKGVPGA